MSKYSLLIASCFLFGNQLWADSIQTITITSLTASAFGSAPLVRFTGSGPSVTISGQQGHVTPPSGLLIGTPIPPISFGLPPNGIPPLVSLAGTIGTTIVQLAPPSGLPMPGPVVSGTTDQLVPASAETITFPGTVKGEYPAFACGTSQVPPNCTGPQIANILIDLPGVISLDFLGFPGAGLNEYDTATFTSIPEPSSVFLLLFGAVILAAGLIARRRKSPNCISDSR